MAPKRMWWRLGLTPEDGCASSLAWTITSKCSVDSFPNSDSPLPLFSRKFVAVEVVTNDKLNIFKGVTEDGRMFIAQHDGRSPRRFAKKLATIVVDN